MKRRSIARALRIGFVIALAGSARAGAQNGPIVVSDPSARAYRAAVRSFADTRAQPDPGHPAALRADLVAALEFSGVFVSVDPRAFLEAVATPALDGAAPVCPNWRQIGADALVEGEIAGGEGALRVEFRVLDVARGCLQLMRKRYRGQPGEAKRIARVIADDIVGAFTGQRGVADTEIAFVSDRSGSREIYLMDADGGNSRRATRNRSINTFPDWAPDGQNIVYTSYRQGDRPGLYLLSRGGRSPGRILRSLANGSQLYRAVFDPEGEQLAVVASHDGGSDIYVVGRNGRGPRRLTHGRAIDIGPAWSPDGKRIAFVSDRSGAPQIYVMEADGGDVRRLTYDGKYNTAPSWSPDGRWIAYEARVSGQFDIWLIDPEGQVNAPLITHPRSDESPSWSPDGRKLAFASTRRGSSDIYVVDVTGENLRRVTDDARNETNPDWGPYRR